MWEAIRSAKHRVWMTTYILKPDLVGLRTIEELTNAAKRGVQVAFIYDHFGSFGFSDVYFEDLRAAGGMVLCFNNITSIANFFRFDFRSNYVLYRNHRKVLVVDNEVGFCGGMNIASDYCGEDVGGNGRFRDTHARIVGPGIVHLADVFLSTLQTMQRQALYQWPQIMQSCLKMAEELPPPGAPSSIRRGGSPSSSRYVSGSKSGPISQAGSGSSSSGDISPIIEKLVKPRPLPYHILPQPTAGSFLQVLSSNSRENKRAIQKALSETIDLAQKHVYLTSPYFLPPASIRQSIIRAAKRGVDVRILTAGKSDIAFITSASAHIYGLFLRAGVRVYELQSQELHAKTVTSDGAVAMVGSYNLDNLSYKHNLEANLNLVDSQLAVNLERQFFEDLKFSKEIIKDRWDNRSWIKRLWHWLVYTAFRFILR
jgi:phosphatidylserine/phosphatidylglycerophosphate/cardiolipin synthase-like enzyme